MNEFAKKFVELSDAKDDAVEHISHLYEMTAPEAFDHDVDDSIYNDQNDTGSDKT